jgi:hypothetical protein
MAVQRHRVFLGIVMVVALSFFVRECVKKIVAVEAARRRIPHPPRIQPTHAPASAPSRK